MKDAFALDKLQPCTRASIPLLIRQRLLVRSRLAIRVTQSKTERGST